jgi:hypothetical protein
VDTYRNEIDAIRGAQQSSKLEYNKREQELHGELQLLKQSKQLLQQEVESLKQSLEMQKRAAELSVAESNKYKQEVSDLRIERERQRKEFAFMESSRADSQLQSLRRELEQTMSDWQSAEKEKSAKDEGMWRLQKDLEREKEKSSLLKTQIGLLDERLRISSQELGVYRSLDVYHSSLNSELLLLRTANTIKSSSPSPPSKVRPPTSTGQHTGAHPSTSMPYPDKIAGGSYSMNGHELSDPLSMSQMMTSSSTTLSGRDSLGQASHSDISERQPQFTNRYIPPPQPRFSAEELSSDGGSDSDARMHRSVAPSAPYSTINHAEPERNPYPEINNDSKLSTSALNWQDHKVANSAESMNGQPRNHVSGRPETEVYSSSLSLSQLRRESKVDVTPTVSTHLGGFVDGASRASVYSHNAQVNPRADAETYLGNERSETEAMRGSVLTTRDLTSTNSISRSSVYNQAAPANPVNAKTANDSYLGSERFEKEAKRGSLLTMRDSAELRSQLHGARRASVVNNDGPPSPREKSPAVVRRDSANFAGSTIHKTNQLLFNNASHGSETSGNNSSTREDRDQLRQQKIREQLNSTSSHVDRNVPRNTVTSNGKHDPPAPQKLSTSVNGSAQPAASQAHAVDKGSSAYRPLKADFDKARRLLAKSGF